MIVFPRFECTHGVSITPKACVCLPCPAQPPP
jgi:hypothetical protein